MSNRRADAVMRTMTLVFYAVVLFFLGILAAPWAATFGRASFGGDGSMIESLEVNLTIAASVFFVLLAVASVFVRPEPGDESTRHQPARRPPADW